MRIRFFLGFILLFVFSCNQLSSKSHKKELLDTIVDYSKVDVSPAFLTCDSLEGVAKTKCFENELQKHVYSELQKHKFSFQENIEETILVIIIINEKGKFKLKEIQSSSKINSLITSLNSVIKKSIESLPIIAPALKHNIPVTTQYTLPIKIIVKE